VILLFQTNSIIVVPHVGRGPCTPHVLASIMSESRRFCDGFAHCN
jgi:hypothetical protein